MNAETIGISIRDILQERGLFLTGIEITPDSTVTITVESNAGTVSIDDCTAINDIVRGTFDSADEDYSLTVTSAGLGEPFRVAGQYIKAIGEDVETGLKGGTKLRGKLIEYDGKNIKIETKMTVGKGKEKKQIAEIMDVPMEKVNYCKLLIKFK
ncbi:MAG: hypothetical protein LKI53_01715 [Bacteroidales bacterium]|jgi:ribosome maturation factor RimP|nr:hypothetical protein [Bacteroidales bacterium]